MSQLKDKARREGRNFSEEDVFQYYKQRTSTNDVQTMLMALSAAVMKADGKVLKAELDFVKSFFQQQFGARFDKVQLQSLKHFIDSGQIPLQQICSDIRSRPKFVFNLCIICLGLQNRMEMSQEVN